MIGDGVRTDAYVRALRAVITPESVVLDIGTGLGTFAFLAAELGARKVYAVEPDDVIELARKVAAQNGSLPHVEFLQELSTAIELPERADVIVSDLRGVLPFYQQHIPSLVDARSRLLAAGGVLLPQRDEVWVTLVSSARQFARHTGAQLPGASALGLSAVDRCLRGGWSRAIIEAGECISDNVHVATLDYATIEQPDMSSHVVLTVSEAGTAHGYCAWFDTTVTGDIGYSNAPGLTKTVYGQAFFPFASAVDVSAGDRVELQFDAKLRGGDYFWAWKTRVLSSSSEVIAEFAQSSLDALLISPTRLHRWRDNYVPSPSLQRDVHHFVLGCVDGQRSLGDIAAAVAAEFPEHFSDSSSALAATTEVMDKTFSGSLDGKSKGGSLSEKSG